MATNTYVALDKVTLGSAQSSITFSSIPQTYTDLVLIENYSLASAGSQSVVTFNGTSSTYSNTNLYGNGSTAYSSRFTGVGGFGSSPGVGDTANNQIVMIRHINNYSNTTTYKTCLQRKSDASDNVWATIGLWQSTAAVNSITCTSYAGNYKSGSTFSLYGIASEGALAKATGGIVTSDANYWYHTFTSSGTFTPSQALTCDVLRIAGGGSGASGGGGAGGLLYSASQSLSSGSAYTATIGAGGAARTSLGATVQGNDGSATTFTGLTSCDGGGGGGGFTGAGTGRNGGSGGGGGSTDAGTSVGGTATSGQGYAGGGNAGLTAAPYASGGGGGAGGTGNNAVSNVLAGAGGTGVNTYSSWPISTGLNGYIAGGGGGGMYTTTATAGTGGAGGGGAGSVGTTTATNGIANTGSGGGGTGVSGNSGAGGSGVIIVRYAK